VSPRIILLTALTKFWYAKSKSKDHTVNLADLDKHASQQFTKLSSETRILQDPAGVFASSAIRRKLMRLITYEKTVENRTAIIKEHLGESLDPQDLIKALAEMQNRVHQQYNLKKDHEVAFLKDLIHPLNIPLLLAHMSPDGKVLPRRITARSLKDQNKVKRAIRTAKHMGYFSYKKGTFEWADPYLSEEEADEYLGDISPAGNLPDTFEGDGMDGDESYEDDDDEDGPGDPDDEWQEDREGLYQRYMQEEAEMEAEENMDGSAPVQAAPSPGSEGEGDKGETTGTDK